MLGNQFYSSSNMSISGKKKKDLNMDLDLLKDVQDGHNYGSGHVQNRQNFNQNSLDSLESECKWSYDINPDLMKPTLDGDNEDDEGNLEQQSQQDDYYNHDNKFKSALSLKTKLSSNTNEVIKEDVNE